MRRSARKSAVLLPLSLAMALATVAGAATDYPGPATAPFDAAKVSQRATQDIRGAGTAQVAATALKDGTITASVSTSSTGYLNGENLPAGPVGVFIEPLGNSGQTYGLAANKGHAYGEINHTLRAIPAGTRRVSATFTIAESAWRADPATGGDGWASLASAVAQVDLVIKYFPATCVGAVPACSRGEFEDRQSIAVPVGFTGSFTISSSSFSAASSGGYVVVQPGLVAQASSRGKGSSSYARISGVLTRIDAS